MTDGLLDGVVWDPNVLYNKVNVYCVGLWKYQRKSNRILLNK